MAKAERNAGESDGDDADEDGAAYAASHQDGDENESRGGEREDAKKQAGKKDDAGSGLPGNAAAEDDGVSEVGVEGHAGREGDGIVGPKAHDERGDGGGNASGEEDAVNGHARFGEDARIRSEERRVG